MNDREVLEQEIKQLEEEASYHRRHGNEAEYNAKMAVANQKRAELSDLTYIEIVEDYQTSDKLYTISVSGAEVNLRDFMESDDNYRVIAIALSQRDLESDTRHRSIVRELHVQFDTERQQFRDQITAADESADAKYNELYEQFHQLKLEKEEIERKHQASTAEIDSLRNQLQQTKVEVPTVTNMDSGALAEAIRKANEAKPRIYNKRAGDSRTSFYLANLSETGEEISIPWTRIGQYVEESPEEAARFREERDAAETAQAQLESAAPVEEVATIVAPELHVPQFQDDIESAGSDLAGDTTETESLQNHDGESFEQEVRRRLEWLESEVDSLNVIRARGAA